MDTYKFYVFDFSINAAHYKSKLLIYLPYVDQQAWNTKFYKISSIRESVYAHHWTISPEKIIYVAVKGYISMLQSTLKNFSLCEFLVTKL